jgi:hypothetical protein
MPHEIHAVSIFLPLLAMVALTFVGFVRMSSARLAAIKGGQDPNYYKAHLGRPEPEFAIAAVRHYNNLFEMPTLLYAACLTAFVLNAVTIWTLLFAWGYIAGRVVQSLVHLIYNNPAHRGVSFSVSILFLGALWVDIAWAVIALAR